MHVLFQNDPSAATLVRWPKKYNPGPQKLKQEAWLPICASDRHPIERHISQEQFLYWLVSLPDVLWTTHEWCVSYFAPYCRSLPPQLPTGASPSNTVRQPLLRVLQQQLPPTARHSLIPRNPRQTRLLKFNCNALQSYIEEIAAFMR